MPGIYPLELTKLVLEALAKAGKRGVLATGGGAIQSDPTIGHAHFIDSAPHEQLFPLMSACVHHGGAGTTGASLRAGKPTIICPFFGDQPFWAKRVEDLGVGPKAIERRKLSSDFLAAAIVEATSNPIHAAARGGTGRSHSRRGRRGQCDRILGPQGSSCAARPCGDPQRLQRPCARHDRRRFSELHLPEGG